MECSNCGEPFKKYEKSYGRKSLVSAEHSEDLLKDVIGTSVTPKGKRDERFLCPECDKLLITASRGETSKQKLFEKTLPGTYLSYKRKSDSAYNTPSKKRRQTPFTSTPLKGKAQKSMSTGSKYIVNYHYKAGFRWFMKRSKAAKRALLGLLLKNVRKEVSVLLRQDLPITKKATFEAIRNLRWDTLFDIVKKHAPILYNVLIGACTYPGNEDTLMRGRVVKGERSNVSLKPVIGSVISQILAQVNPHKASLFQKMNAIQMWRSGCKRSLFSDFYHIGISVAENSLLSTLDKLANSFDKGLRQWKKDLQEHVFHARLNVSDDDGSASDTDMDTSQLSPIMSSESSEESEWEDVADETLPDEPTVIYSEEMKDIPQGYTICWDNVGKQVKARHQTRNHGNKYLCWALAYVAKNRVQSTHLTDHTVIPASEVPLQNYFLGQAEILLIKDRLINCVIEIIVKHVPSLTHLTQMIVQEDHKYTSESKRKSEIFNIGVLSENPSSTAGVINILDNLHRFVPQKEDDGTLYPIITWGDGLSCERHADAQNARANGATPLERLEGLEPSPQEFHKRMILMQETMDYLFDGKSAQDKGTLFHLKNVFNQRSVSKNVSETFNYVSDFLTFVTKGYVLLFGMDVMQMDTLGDTIDLIADMEIHEQEEYVKHVASEIIEKVWCDVTQFPGTEEEMEKPNTYELCFCKEDMDDFDEPMIECQNNDCSKGGWFHYICVGIPEDNVPDVWYCSPECRNEVINYKYCVCKTYKKDEPMIECCNTKCDGQWFHGCCMGMTESQFPDKDTNWFCSKSCKSKVRGKKREKKSEEAVDRKFEYTKLLVWKGLNDMIRRKAVRENNGDMMVLYWKMDLPAFHNGNHSKYFILGHRLITALNGWLPERLRFDLTWNRTVNLNGGRNKNDEMDLVNEFLNREFKDSIKTAGSKYTQETLDRHGKLAGGLGSAVGDIYSSLVEGGGKAIHTRKDVDRQDDLRLMTQILKPEKLTDCIPGRSHKAFQKVSSNQKIKKLDAFMDKIKRHQKRLDKRRRVVAN